MNISQKVFSSEPIKKKQLLPKLDLRSLKIKLYWMGRHNDTADSRAPANGSIISREPDVYGSLVSGLVSLISSFPGSLDGTI